MNICFLGMSHLGIVSSVVAASKGIKVLCFDYKKNKIMDLKQEKFEIEEPDLIETFQKFKKNITYFDDFNEIALPIDIYIISQDIKTLENGKSDLTELRKLLKTIKKVILPHSAVVILSQVPPKFTRKYKKQFPYLYYQVETLIFGQAVKRAKFPERIIVGVDNKENNILHRDFCDFLKLFNCQILVMKVQN